MNALAWAVRLAVVVVLVWFAVRNSQLVTLNGLPGQAWQAPLVFALLVAFVAGVAIGVLAWLPTVFRQRRELARLRRAASAAPPNPPAAAGGLPAPAPPAAATSAVTDVESPSRSGAPHGV